MDSLRKWPALAYWFVFLCSVIIALLIVAANSYFNPIDKDEQYMPTRQDQLNTGLVQLNADLPVSFASITDHKAPYFYLSFLGHFLGKTMAWEIFLIAQLIGVFVLLSLFPLTIYKITKAVIISLVSPVLIYLIAGYFLIRNKSDVNWMFLWILIISIPLLHIYYREKVDSKSSRISFMGLCLAIGVSNIFRAHIALPITIIFIFLGINKIGQFRDSSTMKIFFLCTGALFLIFVSYALFGNIIPMLYALATHQEFPYFKPGIPFI
jgi:hypothetical protein